MVYLCLSMRNFLTILKRHYIAAALGLATVVSLGFLVPTFAATPGNLIQILSYPNKNIPAITAGKAQTFSLQLKNTGTWSWKAGSKLYIKVPYSGSSLFHHASWLTQDALVKIPNGIKPGAKVTVKFTLQAPVTPEEYKLKFYIAGSAKIAYPNNSFTVPVTVVAASTTSSTSDCPGAQPCAPTTTPEMTVATTTIDSAAEETTTTGRVLISEPSIRVGLFSTTSPVQFVSSFLYEVYAGDESQGFLNQNTTGTLEYAKGVYTFTASDTSFSSDLPIRLVPREDGAYFILPSYYRHVAGRKPASFNAYRGTMEYSFGPISKKPFVINELPLDAYTAGIAETTNESAPEYIRALIIAARTYGYTRIAPVSSKHLYDVEPTSVDQIYLGYYSEAAMPAVAQAVSDTAGMMVTYNGAPIITNYFGHSDGKTRNGPANRPWLKSVTAIYDKGLTLWGHGIGMSCHDASMRALKDGWGHEQILTYYYSGTKVEKVY